MTDTSTTTTTKAPRRASRTTTQAPAQATDTTTQLTAADRLAAALSGPAAHAPAPEGYSIRWPKPAFDLLKRQDGAPEGSPAWLVRCNAHGTTTPAKDTREGDTLGTVAQRPTWCPGCKKDQAAKARAEARAQAAKAAK